MTNDNPLSPRTALKTVTVKLSEAQSTAGRMQQTAADLEFLASLPRPFERRALQVIVNTHHRQRTFPLSYEEQEAIADFVTDLLKERMNTGMKDLKEKLGDIL